MYLNKLILQLAMILISTGMLFLFYGNYPPFGFMFIVTGLVIAVSMGIFALIFRRAVTVFEMTGILISLGIVCLLSFSLIEPTIDEKGILHEPFFLVSQGYSFIFIGVILGLVHLIKGIISAKKLASNNQKV